MKVQDVAIPEPAVPALHIQKILVPIDFSTPCNKAFKYALGFARHFGSQIVMIHVIEPAIDTELLGGKGMQSIQNELALAKEKMQALADDSPRDTRLHITSGIRKGVATHEIVQAAEELDVDLVIMATHGLSGLKHFGLGSTADRVARAAPCPVLVVREREREFI
jgi:nucleotide-binding universal stress UspA family protein